MVFQIHSLTGREEFGSSNLGSKQLAEGREVPRDKICAIRVYIT
jgi:hypothetical protein